MMDIKRKAAKYICECCGGTINPYTLKCEYCDTEYEGTRAREPHREPPSISYIPSHYPIHTYTRTAQFDRHQLLDLGEENTCKYVRERMARQIAEELVDDIILDGFYDMVNNRYQIIGTLKAVCPTAPSDPFKDFPYWRKNK